MARCLRTNPDAIGAQHGPGYLIRLSSDGKQVLYATYLAGAISGMSLAPDGKLWLTGSIASDSPEYRGLGARLKLTFGSDVPLASECFVASFNIALRKFTSFANVGLTTEPFRVLRSVSGRMGGL